MVPTREKKPMITKFKKNIPIDSQLTPGDIYLCPFTSQEKIWTSYGGFLRVYEINPSEAIKKCGKKLSRVKDREKVLKAAAKELCQI